MPSFRAVLLQDNNYKRDRNKSNNRLPAVVIRFSPLKEKLMRKERRVAANWQLHRRTTVPKATTGVTQP